MSLVLSLQTFSQTIISNKVCFEFDKGKYLLRTARAYPGLTNYHTNASILITTLVQITNSYEVTLPLVDEKHTIIQKKTTLYIVLGIIGGLVAGAIAGLSVGISLGR